MDYRKLDDSIIFDYKTDLYKDVKSLKYNFISEATIDLYLKGLSLNDIAKKFGKTRFTIGRWLKRWNIPLRSRGGCNNRLFSDTTFF